MKPIKQTVAYVIYSPDRSKVLAVFRSANDANFPNMWGLPAGTLKEGESHEEAVITSGRERLGIELRIVKLINEGEAERGKHILHMKEYEAEIVEGTPAVPQLIENVTQYAEWKWANPEILKEASERGALCSRLFLSSG